MTSGVLAGERLLEMWSAGQERPRARAGAMLAAAYPDSDPAELVALPLGQRDGLLLDARLRLIGPTLTCLATCPACGEMLEFSVDVADVRAGPAPAADVVTVTVGDTVVVARPLTGADLDAVAGARTVADARAALIGRCVLSVTRDGRDAAVGSLTDSEVGALGEALEAHDPWTDVRTRLSCLGCGRAIEAALDVAAFVWSEMAIRARTLLLEVDALARRYGWSEQEIVALGPARRRLYLDLA